MNNIKGGNGCRLPQRRRCWGKGRKGRNSWNFETSYKSMTSTVGGFWKQIRHISHVPLSLLHYFCFGIWWFLLGLFRLSQRRNQKATERLRRRKLRKIIPTPMMKTSSCLIEHEERAGGAQVRTDDNFGPEDDSDGGVDWHELGFSNL